MPANYVLLATQTVGNSGAASVTFSNIPQSGYTDLKIVLSARSTANGGQNINLTFNSTTSGYSDKILSGNGSAASSFSSGNTARGGSCVIPGADFTANTFGNGEILIPNYTSGNAKSFSSDSVTENNTTLSYAQMQATLWNNAAAINTILIDLSGGSFAAGSTFYLYGLAAVGTTPVIAPFASGGDVIANDGTYWYHAFKTTGAFVPAKALSCDVLVVAGGGGGADNIGGAGGAGGLRYLASQSFALNTSYTATIGAGGNGAPGGGGQANGSKGSNSSFASISATGGGYGAIGDVNGGNGGSGGGTRATVGNGGTGNEGGYSPVEGYNGGKGVSGTTAGGGGGAGAVGQTAPSTSQSGAGGAGLNTYSAFATATATGSGGYYAGGGGGGGYPAASVSAGAGGSGGGGAGGNGSTPGTSGTANTGGGGGGGSSAGGTQYAGGNGGSGIVIIRYAMA